MTEAQMAEPLGVAGLEWVDHTVDIPTFLKVGPILEPEKAYILDGFRLIRQWVDQAEEDLTAGADEYVASNVWAVAWLAEVLYECAKGRALQHLHAGG